MTSAPHHQTDTPPTTHFHQLFGFLRVYEFYPSTTNMVHVHLDENPEFATKEFVWNIVNARKHKMRWPVFVQRVIRGGLARARARVASSPYARARAYP